MATTAVTVITGGFPTDTPTVLTTAKAIPCTNWPSVDVLVKTSANSGVVTLIGWDSTATAWFPIGDTTLSTAYGGNALDRWSVGAGGFTHLAIWEKTAGATITAAYIRRGVKR